MTPLLYGLGGFCVRRRWIVVGVWVVIVATLAIWARAAGPNTTDNLTLPGSDSQQATDLLTARFPQQANGTNPVVLTAPAGKKVTDDAYQQPIADAVAAFKTDPDVRDATSPLSQAGASLLSQDQRIGVIALNLRAAPSDLTTDDAQRIVDEAGPLTKAGLAVAAGGYVGQKVSKPETHSSEAVGLSMAVLVLLLTFGTVVAMGLPIVTALLGLVSGLSIITLISHVADVPTVAPTLATMIGLGVGIDYALFIVTRHQEQRRSGLATRESIARATATSGGAVVFAGTTVIVALLSLAVVGIPLVTTLGYTAAIVVLVAMAAATTLLPALLAILGDRIDALALPHRRRADATAGAARPHGWERWAEGVARRPAVGTLAALALLITLAIPALTLYLGQQDNGALPTDTQARRAYDGMTAAFGVGSNGPLLVAVDLSAKPATGADDARLAALSKDIGSTKDVASVSPPSVNGDGTAAVLTVTPKTAPSDQATEQLVRRLRETTIPAATKDQQMTADVGGTTAGYVDLADEISGRLVLTIAVVVGLSFLLLVLAFRSLVIPLTAGIMNLISIGAAFGVVTAVFEKGWGVGIVGLDDSVAIVSYVPLMMFAILFGLSMDYEVFLMTHIKEAWERTHDNRQAVIDGVAHTGRVITSAALIMVSVFFAFILNGDPTVKQFGVGMGVAVAVDATVVRCLLVPSVMTLLGKANWWFPSWLDRVVPDFSIEGAEWFRQRDREAAAGAVAETASPVVPVGVAEKSVPKSP
ncbi:Membrane protein YdfJ [Baekduia alba]|uniref:MMPL family transporter n=1 Tax=Baekduia alba TaxID=2997333 RepID=UPI002341E83B|nr:MMPL family transporter [Baekduia alba]WCB93661.1 Membrane protein YdfJ [Baekduia alba]